MDLIAYGIYACIALVALVIGVMILAFIWMLATGLRMTPGNVGPRFQRKPPTD
jgi:hypothetical protein